MVTTFNRRETVYVPVARVWVAFRSLGRADTALPQAHRSQAVQVHRLRALFRAVRPPRAAHEAALTEDVQMTLEEGRWPAALYPGRRG